MLNEQQIANNISSALDEYSTHLTAMQIAQLKTARQHAIGVHQKLVSVQARGFAGVTNQVFDYIHHHRAMMSTGLVFGVLLLAVFVVQPLQTNPKNSDAFLLGSELPPEAYADKGFDTWVEKGT